MKTLNLSLLFLMIVGLASAQTFKVRLKPEAMSYSDTLSKNKIAFSNKSTLTAEVINKGSKYLLVSDNDKFVYVPCADIKPDGAFYKWAVENRKIYSDDALYLIADEVNKRAYYQETIKVDSSSKKSSIYDKVKQWAASVLASTSIQLSYDKPEEGKLVFSMVENLYIPQGFGSIPFECRYTYTIDIKDAKYRYTVDNIEFGYLTLMLRNGKRETLYSQYLDCGRGDDYNNSLKRILSFQKHIKMQTDNLQNLVNQSSLATKTDF